MKGCDSDESKEGKLGGAVCPFCGTGGSHPSDWDSWWCGRCNRDYPTSASKCRVRGCWEFAYHKNYCDRHRARETGLSATTPYSVLVMDLFHFMDHAEETLETGFPTWEAARNYARARTWSSVEEHKREGLSADQVKNLWMTFGESAIVIGGPSYSATDEIDYFLSHNPSPEEADYSRIVRVTKTHDVTPSSIQEQATPQPAKEPEVCNAPTKLEFPSVRIESVGAWALAGLIVGITSGLVRVNVHLSHSTYQSLFSLEQLIWFVDAGFLLPIWGSTAGRKWERDLAWGLYFAIWGFAIFAFIVMAFRWI